LLAILLSVSGRAAHRADTRTHIYTKLGFKTALQNCAEMIRYALGRGLLGT
jgi:hypothetical protein